MPTQTERSAAMRQRLIDVGRSLFAERGYGAVSTNALLAEAGVSKGALYHHFPSKKALFEAIFERVAEESIARALDRADSEPGASELDLLVENALRWLDRASEAGVSRILLEDGPAVLGFERARDLEAKTSLGLMMHGLERAARERAVEIPNIELAARLINAALAEAALVGLREETPPSRDEIEETIRKLVTGLISKD